MKKFILASIVVIGFSSVAHAVVYDARADYSSSNNPNGVWSYGTAATPGGAMTLMSRYVSNNSYVNGPEWASSPPGTGNAMVCDIWQEFENGVLHAPSANEIVVSPAYMGFTSNIYGIVRWTAPQTGIVNIDSHFNGLDTGVKDLVVSHNSNQLFNQRMTGYSFSAFSQNNLPVNSGDVIDFAIGPANWFFDDGVGVKATIGYVPEPSSLILLGMGALSLIYVWRRRSGSR